MGTLLPQMANDTGTIASNGVRISTRTDYPTYFTNAVANLGNSGNVYAFNVTVKPSFIDVDNTNNCYQFLAFEVDGDSVGICYYHGSEVSNYYPELAANYTYEYNGSHYLIRNITTASPATFSIQTYTTLGEGLVANNVTPIAIFYPITYSYTNSTVSGPAEAAAGVTVTVSAVPNTDYGITDPATQISVTNNDVPVNFTWDAATNTITFIMPDPT